MGISAAAKGSTVGLVEAEARPFGPEDRGHDYWATCIALPFEEVCRCGQADALGLLLIAGAVQHVEKPFVFDDVGREEV